MGILMDGRAARRIDILFPASLVESRLSPAKDILRVEYRVLTGSGSKRPKVGTGWFIDARMLGAPSMFSGDLAVLLSVTSGPYLMIYCRFT